MKYFFLALLPFFAIHKTIDALNPWWRLLIFPLIFLVFKFKGEIRKDLNSLCQKRVFQRTILILFIALFSFRMGKSLYNIYRPLKAIEDIAVVHKKAVGLLFKEKENPYQHILFEQAPITITRKGKTDTYSGFIYTPLGIIYYAPFILLLGKKGMYAGNFFGYWGLFITLLLLFRFEKTKMLLAGSLFLAVDYVFTKAFNRGTNDFLPSLMMLLCLVGPKRMSGPFLGLSLGFKQYPGAILSFILLFKGRLKTLIIGGVVFLIVLLPFMIHDFHSLYRQIFEVFLFAPMGNTILWDVPKFLIWPISLTAVLGMSGLSWYYRKRDDWLGIFLVFLVFIIFTKSSFTTYFIAIFPISIVWLLEGKRYIKEEI